MGEWFDRLDLKGVRARAAVRVAKRLPGKLLLKPGSQ